MRINTTIHIVFILYMKYYETKFEDYINSSQLSNLHPIVDTYKNNLPVSLSELHNIILYGPKGIGKYTQALNIISFYSPSVLKYDKLLTISNDKQDITIRISDIHFEVDMSLLGCNSKTLWYDIFFQISDIVSLRTNKSGIILCKNFHTIHNELLEIFYSYMHHFSKNHPVKLIFFIITEQISFLPTSITQQCYTMQLGRPSISSYENIITRNKCNSLKKDDFLAQVSSIHSNVIYPSNKTIKTRDSYIDMTSINNIKELKWLNYINEDNFPLSLQEQTFDALCQHTQKINNINFLKLRELLYDLLTYNIDIQEVVLLYIKHFINEFNTEDISDILTNSYKSFKYFNNNYRPIYHLEKIFLYIIAKRKNE